MFSPRKKVFSFWGKEKGDGIGEVVAGKWYAKKFWGCCARGMGDPPCKGI